MTGNRKYKAFLWAMVAELAAFAAVTLKALPADYLTTFNWGLFGILSSFVGGNSVEHFTNAKPPTPKP